MKNEEQFAGFKFHFWPLDQFGPETAQNGVPPFPHRRPPRVRQNDSVAAMHQSAPHHCRTLLPRVLAPATRRLALCSSKTMRQRCPSIHSLPTSLFTPSLALPLAPSVVAAIAGRPSSSCRCCQRYCCPSASRCPATQSLPRPPAPHPVPLLLPCPGLELAVAEARPSPLPPGRRGRATVGHLGLRRVAPRARKGPLVLLRPSIAAGEPPLAGTVSLRRPLCFEPRQGLRARIRRKGGSYLQCHRLR